MGTIYYKLYNPSGLFNQVISLEIGIGLSEVLNKNLLLYNINNPNNREYNNKIVPIYTANYKYNKRGNFIDQDVFPSIVDLIDWKNKDECTFINNDVDHFIDEDACIIDLMEYYYSDSNSISSEEALFSENRKKIPLVNNIHLQKTLGYYSRFFYNRNKLIDSTLKSVKFKKEYYDVAYNVAKSLGSFNGAHLRLTDHIRYTNMTLQNFDEGLEQIKDKTIVLCTDESGNDIVKNSSHNFILLDEYIIKNFYEEFRQLKFKEEVSFGILNNLVMHYSHDFIGTPGSTFSGYIQRSINQKKDYQWKLFKENNHFISGPYSWNGYSKDTITKQWWREWKESKLLL